MARPADTLRPAWKVYYELAHHDRYGDREVALRILRDDLAGGVRVAVLDGRELPRAFWKDHRIRAHAVGYYCFAEHDAGGEVAGRLLISDPVPEPTQVVLRPVKWLGDLLRGLFGGKAETEPAAVSDEAWGDRDYQSCGEWLRRATKEEPQKPGEGPSEYARRLADVRKGQLRRNPTGKVWGWDTIRTRLDELRRNPDQS